MFALTKSFFEKFYRIFYQFFLTAVNRKKKNQQNPIHFFFFMSAKQSTSLKQLTL